MKDRRDEIFRFISSRTEVSLAELAEHFPEWSEMTLRRDLAYLEKNNSLILTRGGARVLPTNYGLTEDIYSKRALRNHNAKQLIAASAAELIEQRTGIFIDSGTTAMALAKMIPNINLVIITSGPNIGLEIAMQKDKPEVILLGGALSGKSISVTDAEAASQIAHLNIDTAFMSTSGFDVNAGFTVGTQQDAILKRTVIKQARRIVMMMDLSKVGLLLPYTFARIEDIDILIVDSPLSLEITQKLNGVVRVIDNKLNQNK